MASIHVAYLGQFTVNQSGSRIDKTNPNTPISAMLNTSMATLVIQDSTIQNTQNYPNLKSYLEAEIADGFVLQHLSQNIVITYKQ
jgi:hypothetical protein